MMMTALLAKKHSNDDSTIKVYYAFLNHNYPKFMESYKVWESYLRLAPETISIDKISLNFNQLFGNP
jgi:hypothetical protein